MAIAGIAPPPPQLTSFIPEISPLPLSPLEHYPSVSFVLPSSLSLSAYSFRAGLRGDTSQLLWLRPPSLSPPPATGHTELVIVAPDLGPPWWRRGGCALRPRPDDGQPSRVKCPAGVRKGACARRRPSSPGSILLDPASSLRT